MKRNDLTEKITPEELFTKQNEEYLSEYRIRGDGWWIDKCEVIPSQYTKQNTDSNYEVDFRAYIRSDKLVGEVVLRAGNQHIELKQVTASVGEGFETHQFEEYSYNSLEELCEIISSLLTDFKNKYYEEALQMWKDEF